MPVWRVIFVVAVGLLTSGCLFSAYQIASLTASGISYVVSGRSVGDHALSLALTQDCATHRILEGEEICVDFPQDDTDTLTSVALATDFPEYDNALDDAPDAVSSGPAVQLAESVASGFAGTPRPVSTTQPRFIPASVTETSLASEMAPADTASAKPVVTAGLDLDSLLPAGGPEDDANRAMLSDTPRIYLVIGSFKNSENAEKLGKQHNNMNTAIMTLETRGRTMYRVVAGPIDDGALQDTRSRFREAGIGNTWAVRLCQGDLAMPPCRETMLQQAQLPGL